MGEIYSEKAVNYWLDLGAANTCIREIEAENAELRARLEKVEREAGVKYWQTCTMDLRARLEAVREWNTKIHILEQDPIKILDHLVNQFVLLDAILSGDGEKGGDLSKKPRNLDISEKRVDGGEKGGG